MIEVQFGLAQRQDLTVTFTDPRARRSLYELASIPGVPRAEPFRTVPVRLRAGHRTYRTAIQGYERGSDLHRTLDADLEPVAACRQRGVLLTRPLAQAWA